jgi:hypothetical protein
MTRNRISSPLQQVEMIGKLADLKDSQYRNTLLLTALVELLIDKGVISRKELIDKSMHLESTLMSELQRKMEESL